MPKFISASELVESACFAAEDTLQRKKMRFSRMAIDVYTDLNLEIVKEAKREVMQINKRTNSVQLPKNTIDLSGVSIIDCWGNTYPVYRNDSLRDDLIDIAADQNCNCTCKNELCNMIKGYESVITYVDAEMPDSSTRTFTCITRKATDTNGFYYETTQYPQRIYEDSVWVDTVLHTEYKELCKLQVDGFGCVVDCQENIDKVNSCGCISSCATVPATLVNNGGNIPVGGTAMSSLDGANPWIYACSSGMDTFSVECGTFFSKFNCFNNIYNITELGDRLIFPADFGWDKVLVRYFRATTFQDIGIPLIAKDTFISGLLWFDVRWKPDAESQKLAAIFGQKYAFEKQGLMKELNKYRIAELGTILAPRVYVPSYVYNINQGNLYYTA